MPTMVASMKGWVNMFFNTFQITLVHRSRLLLPIDISRGARVKCMVLSRQKIRATGTPASGPNAAIANGGPR